MDKAAVQHYWDTPRKIASLRVLVEIGAEHGLRPAQCLHQTELTPEMLTQSKLKVEAQQELQVIRNLLNELGDEYPLGLEAGNRIHLPNYGLLGMALLSSLTAYRSLQLGIRFINLGWTYCKPKLINSGDEVLLIGDDSQLPEDVRDFLLLRDAASLFSLQRAVVPVSIPITRLEFKQNNPAYGARILDVTGYNAEFGRSRNCISVKRSVLDRKLPQADASALKQWEEECENQLREQDHQTGLVGRINKQIRDTDEPQPAFKQIANSLDIHPRTLRRRLMDQRLNYRVLLEAQLYEQACDLLANNNQSIADIAELLGYSEASSFSRAFKRWTGVSPQQYRSAQ